MKRYFPEQLLPTTDRAQVYYLVGTDPLLLSETEDKIQQIAAKQGFDEKLVFQIENSTDWQEIFALCQSIGLFSDKRIIVLDLPENLTALLQNRLSALAELLHTDVLCILRLVKLTKAMEKQAWFTSLNQYDKYSILVDCQTPAAEQLPNWVLHRTKDMGLQIDHEAIQLLCYHYENNLLALKQILQLLALLYPDHHLTFSRVEALVEQSAVYTPFQWLDAILAGKVKRAMRILSGLRDEEVQPIILLRTLQKELMTILALTKPQQALRLSEHLPLSQLKDEFDRLKVWQNRRPLFLTAIQRLTYQKLYSFFQQLADIERLAKQEFSDEVWARLADLSAQIAR